MLDKHIALLDEDVSRGQKSAKYRIFPQEVVRNGTPVPPKLRPLRCQTCHEWPLHSPLWLFPGAGTEPKVKLHFGSALQGANLSTWGTTDMKPNGTRLPARQRSGPGRPAHRGEGGLWNGRSAFSTAEQRVGPQPVRLSLTLSVPSISP